ncbi:hypothetical protein KVT40_006354 [Elsinoe batatas]|uniref:Myb-like domain-containing protein n=1 Tax=Elsinoe batatas TaxID=2601811 RepID=A0A8K0L0G7_9PEZI|nr:hypothetical protein KVT40_006354 [Elsinoe batatas]
MNVPPPPIPPWSPSERLELLAEILKANPVAPETILPIVRNLPEPRWEDLPLPRGRSLNQCRQLYYDYVRQSPAPPIGLSRSTSVREIPRPLDIAGMKRPYGMEGPSSAPMSGQRYQDIQPKPAGLGPMLNPSESSEPPKKKRGRPTKAESELRKEQAARQRGDSISNIRRDTVFTAGPSGMPSLIAQQAAQAVMTPTLQSLPKPTLPQETSSGKRKRLTMTRDEAESRPPPESDEDLVEGRPGAAGHARTPSRGYPDILTRQPDEGPSSFRAPRGE